MSNNTRVVEVHRLDDGTVCFQHYPKDDTYWNLPREQFSEPASLYLVTADEGLKFGTEPEKLVVWMSDAHLMCHVLSDGCLRLDNYDMSKREITFKLNVYDKGNPSQSNTFTIVNDASSPTTA